MTTFGYIMLLIGILGVLRGILGIKKKRIFFEFTTYTGNWAVIYGITTIVISIFIIATSFILWKK